MEGADKVSGKKVRVVSMPSWELFEEQSDDYKESVLPSDVTARVSIEVMTLLFNNLQTVDMPQIFKPWTCHSICVRMLQRPQRYDIACIC